MKYLVAVFFFSTVLALSTGQYAGGNRNTGRGYYQGRNNDYNGYNRGGFPVGQGNANSGYAGYNNNNNNNIGYPGYIAIDPPYFPGSNGYGDFSNINNQRFTGGYSG